MNTPPGPESWCGPEGTTGVVGSLPRPLGLVLMRAVETLSVPGTQPGVLQAVHAFEDFGRAHELAFARVYSDDTLERRVVEILRAGGIVEHR